MWSHPMWTPFPPLVDESRDMGYWHYYHLSLHSRRKWDVGETDKSILVHTSYGAMNRVPPHSGQSRKTTTRIRVVLVTCSSGITGTARLGATRA